MNIYQTCYDLINTYVYGNSVVVDTYQDLVCILFSTVACLAVMSIPFVIVYWVIKFIVSVFGRIFGG